MRLEIHQERVLDAGGLGLKIDVKGVGMNEYMTVWQFTGAMVGLTAATTLYMLGGRANKWLRRYGASLVLALTVNLLCALRGIWSPWFLLVSPLLIGGFSMGYGANGTWTKFFRRLLYAMAIITSGLVFALVLGGNTWLLLVPHVGIGIWSVWLGIKNPIEAASEEGLVCAILNVVLIAYPFVQVGV